MIEFNNFSDRSDCCNADNLKMVIGKPSENSDSREFIQYPLDKVRELRKITENSTIHDG